MSRRIITLGTWNGNPIEWLVLKEESFGTLVISKELLFNYKFNQNRNDGNKWEGSSLRGYMNNEFFKTTFTEEEKKKIVNVYLSDPDSTKDNVFVLSVNEVDKLMTQSERATGNLLWTRTPNVSESIYACRIGPDGGFDYKGRYSGYSYVDNMFYVRPAMYIKEK